MRLPGAQGLLVPYRSPTVLDEYDWSHTRSTAELVSCLAGSWRMQRTQQPLQVFPLLASGTVFSNLKTVFALNLAQPQAPTWASTVPSGAVLSCASSANSRGAALASAGVKGIRMRAIPACTASSITEDGCVEAQSKVKYRAVFGHTAPLHRRSYSDPARKPSRVFPLLATPSHALMSLRLSYHFHKTPHKLCFNLSCSFAGTVAAAAAPFSKRGCGLGNTSTSRTQAAAHPRAQHG